MKVLIIEDELLAQEKLAAMLTTIDPGITIETKLGSVKDAVEWLRRHNAPDLAFCDIQLSDDHSFEIFRQVPIAFPVVFTTAFDKYLLESFEYNSIDYLLKPITEEKLRRSLSKMRNLERHFVQGNLNRLISLASTPSHDRILAKKGTEFVTLTADEVAFFYTEHKVVFVKDLSGRQFMVDKNLGELESILDPRTFFRINRKFLVHIKAIEKFRPDNGKIRVFLKLPVTEEIHVSKETAPEFRRWIGG